MNSTLSTFPTYLHWLMRRCSPRAADPATALSLEESQRFQLAFHRAYRAFVPSHAQWVSRSFDADLLRPELAEFYRRQSLSGQPLNTQAVAIQLSLHWDAQYGAQFTTEQRIRQIGELTRVAAALLALLDKALREESLQAVTTGG